MNIDFEALDMQNGLPIGTTRSVAQTESNMNPKAVSPAGAQGLMQIMPGTAGDLGLSNPFDPIASAEAGSRYLGQLAKRYGGNIEKALQAYNFGMGNVDKGRALPAETQAYAPKVQAAQLAFLEQKLGGGEPQGLSLDDLEASLFGAQEPQGLSLDDLESSLFPVTQDWQSSEDVPQVGGAGATGEWSSGATASFDPVRQARENPPGYLNIIPPAGRGTVESLVRGATAPVRAAEQLLTLPIPDALEKKVLGGQTRLEQMAQGEQDYQARRHDPKARDYARLTGEVAASLPLSAIPVPAALGKVGAGIVKGAGTAAAQPVDSATTKADLLKSKAIQVVAGAGVGGALGAVGATGGRAADTYKAVKAARDMIKGTPAQKLAAMSKLAGMGGQKSTRVTAAKVKAAAPVKIADVKAKVAQSQAVKNAKVQAVQDKAVQVKEINRAATKEAAGITAKAAGKKAIKEVDIVQKAQDMPKSLTDPAAWRTWAQQQTSDPEAQKLLLQHVLREFRAGRQLP